MKTLEGIVHLAEPRQLASWIGPRGRPVPSGVNFSVSDKLHCIVPNVLLKTVNHYLEWRIAPVFGLSRKCYKRTFFEYVTDDNAGRRRLAFVLAGYGPMDISKRRPRTEDLRVICLPNGTFLDADIYSRRAFKLYLVYSQRPAVAIDDGNGNLCKRFHVDQRYMGLNEHLRRSISHHVIGLSALLGQLLAHHSNGPHCSEQRRPPTQRAHPCQKAVLRRIAHGCACKGIANDYIESDGADDSRPHPKHHMIRNSQANDTPTSCSEDIIVTSNEVQCRRMA